MYKIIKLSLKNFLCFKEETLSFKEGCFLIQGINKESFSATSSNGTGKSSLMEAVYFALTGGSLRGITLKQLIRHGERECEVELTLKSDETTLFIRRQLARGQSLEVKLNGLGVGQETVDLKGGNEYILKQLGLSIEELDTYFFISRKKYNPFPYLSNTEKIVFLNKLTDSEKIQKVIEKFDVETKSLEKAIGSKQSEITFVEGKLAANKEALSTLKEEDLISLADKRFEQESRVNATIIETSVNAITALKMKIETANNEVRDLEGVFAEKEKALLAAVSDYEDALQDFSAYKEQNKKEESDTIKLKETLRREMLKEKKQLEEILSRKNEIEGEGKSIKAFLKNNSIVCPSCLSNIVVTQRGAIKPEELEVKLQGLRTQYEEAKEQESTVLSRIKKIELDVEKLDKQLNDIALELKNKLGELSPLFERKETLAKEKSSLEGFILNKKNQVLNANKDILKHTSNLESAKSRTKEDILQQLTAENNAQVNRLNGVISACEEQRRELERELSEIGKDLAFNKKVVSLFDRFNRECCSMSLVVIEKAVNSLLQKICNSLSVRTSMNTALSSGGSSDKISVIPLFEGLELSSFWQCSCGERTRIELAFLLICHELMNMTALRNGGYGLSLLMIDEVLDGVDPVGMSEILEHLSLTKGSFFIISQLDLSHQNKILIIKKDGHSTISF